MNSQEELSALASLLRGQNNPATTLPPERLNDLLLKGILVELEKAVQAPPETIERNASPDPLELIEEAAAQPEQGLRAQAYDILLRLAEAGNLKAIDALYRLAVEHQNLAARQAILARGWQPGTPALQALFDWFSHLEGGTPFPEAELPLLTQAYFNLASPTLQRRLHATAPQVHAENWSRIIQMVEEDSEAALVDLVERYPTFRPTEREIVLEQLDRLAGQGSAPARGALGLLFIRHEDQRARQMVIQNNYLPDDPEQRALFLFLGEEWAAYDTLDFDHSLLLSAYETAGRSLRRRLLEHSRHTGQMEWTRGLSLSGGARWLSDLSDADWDLSIRRLTENEHYADLWRLAQVAPPLWSAAILQRLSKLGWQPKGADEQAGFTSLAALAQVCLSVPLAIQPKKNLHAPAQDFTCLAMHPGGRILAAGCSDSRIFQWNLPDGNLRDAEIIGPAPMTRALVYSPDGELLAAASGDNRIRVFRLSGGQMLKTLEGHRAMIRALAIHPDGRTLYSAGFDGAIRFWRFPYGPELNTLRPGGDEVFSMALGANGQHLLTCGADSLVRVWNLPDGTAARELEMHTDTVTHLAASPTSELVASAGREGMIHLWNYSSGGLVRSFANSSSPITALLIHSTDQVLIGGRNNGEIVLWSLSTGREIAQLRTFSQPITGLVLTPDGNTLYSADNGGHLMAWDLRTFLAARLPGLAAQPGILSELQDRLKNAQLPPDEKKWLTFAVELARWRQRYDIELADIPPIQIGEFDIEL